MSTWALLAGAACLAAARLVAQESASAAPGALPPAPVSATPTAPAPAPAPAAFADNVVQMETLKVSGHRVALQMSLDTKRKADAIIDVITAEDVGKFPDNNVAESLSHMPGITVDRLFGEGEKVSILGTDPALNRTLLNGQTVASADWFINDQPGRTFNYTLLASEIIGRAEVYKTTEARIDEGSIGGTVILHMRSPLDMPANTVAASAAYNYNDRREKGAANFSLLYSWKDSSGKFGFTIAGQSSADKIRRDGVETYGTAPATAYAASALPVFTSNTTARGPNTVSTAYFTQDRDRLGYNATAIWKPGKHFDLTFNTLYVEATYDNVNQSMYIFPADGASSPNADSATVSNNIITGVHVTSGNSYLDVQYRLAEVKTEVYDLKAAWHGNHWNLSAQGGYTKATGGTQREMFAEFVNRGSAYGYDISGAPGRPGTITYDNPDVPKNPALWITGTGWGGSLSQKPTSDKESYGQADYDLSLSHFLINKIRAGVKYRVHETTQTSRAFSLQGAQWAASLFNPSLTPSDYLDGFDGINDDMRRRVVIDGSNMADALNAHVGDTPLAPNYANTWDIEEKISAAYVQLDYAWHKFSGNLGLRAIRTEQTSNGYIADPATPTVFHPTAIERTYDNWLPSFNIAYEAVGNFIIRGAASQVIARPNYADLTPYLTLNGTVLTGAGGNPTLDPYKSNNYDLSAEWYIDKHSIIALNLFLKDIGNYILYTTAPEQHYSEITQETATYVVSRPRNAGSAKSKGASLFYQQALGYGFGIQANYTYSDAEANNGAPLPYNSKHQVNISPYFEKGPWMLRLTYAWRSKYFTGVDRGDNLYTDDYTQLDANASYQITENIQVGIDAVNILDETYYTYANVPGQLRGAYKNGIRLGATLRVKF